MEKQYTENIDELTLDKYQSLYKKNIYTKSYNYNIRLGLRSEGNTLGLVCHIGSTVDGKISYEHLVTLVGNSKVALDSFLKADSPEQSKKIFKGLWKK